MKKYIISLIVILSVLFGFMQTPYAAVKDYTLTNLAASQDLVYGKYVVSAELTVTKNTDTQNGMLLLAFYSEKGMAIDIGFYNISELLSLSSGESKTFSTGVMSFDKQVKSIKAMVWNEASNMKPSAEAITLSDVGLTTEKYYAIVEGYADTSADDYIDVFTLDGIAKRLYIDNTATATDKAAEVIETIKGSAISGTESFAGAAPDRRVIEYTINKSTDKVYDIQLITATAFTQSPFSSTENMLYQPLAENVTILDAIGYIKKDTEATTADYSVSSLSELRDSIKYSGFLVHPNTDGKYQHLVITWMDYAAVNDEMLTKLRSCSADIQNSLTNRVFPVGNQRNLITTIKNCIDDAITYGTTDIIDSNFIRRKYGYDGGPIDIAKGYYNAIQADPTQKGLFQNNLSNLDENTLTWLGIEFGVL